MTNVFSRLILYGGRFDPLSTHHKQIVAAVLEKFNHLIVVACAAYGHKASIKSAGNAHIRQMLELGLSDLPGIEFDFTDLDQNRFTPALVQQTRYQALYPLSEIWHVVGGDLVRGGGNGMSDIQRLWWKGPEVWDSLNFVVISHEGCPIKPPDLPPHSMTVEIEQLFGRSTFVRKRVAAGLPIDELVPPAIAEYIATHGLYRSGDI